MARDLILFFIKYFGGDPKTVLVSLTYESEEFCPLVKWQRHGELSVAIHHLAGNCRPNHRRSEIRRGKNRRRGFRQQQQRKTAKQTELSAGPAHATRFRIKESPKCMMNSSRSARKNLVA
jgi:hypothetical protein